MISPHTPPGTKVRLCDEASHGRETRDGRVVVDHEVVGVAPDLGKVGMVRKIIVHSSAPSGFVAFVDGFVLPSDLAALNYVDLPECLTSCLTSQPLVREEELTGAAGVSCVPRRSLVAGAATIFNSASNAASSPSLWSRFPACAGHTASRANSVSRRTSSGSVPHGRSSPDLARGVSASRALSGICFRSF